MELYVGGLDYYCDDYKRIEPRSNVVIVSRSREEAFRKTLEVEVLQNLGMWTDNRSAAALEYMQAIESLKNETEFSKEFLRNWEEKREAALGEPEYQMYSSGDRYWVVSRKEGEAQGNFYVHETIETKQKDLKDEIERLKSLPKKRQRRYKQQAQED